MNNSLLSFNPVFSTTLIIIIGLSLSALFVYNEFQRKQKFLTWRIIALSVIMISLLGVLLQPAYHVREKSESVLLLTKGYQQSKVDSFIRENSTLKIIRTTDAAPYSNASILQSWYELNEENIFCVVGQGIPPYALDLFQNKTFQFIRPSLPHGIVKLIVPTDLSVNDRAQIQGSFNTTERMKLKLIGPGGAEDSITMNSGEIPFTLSFSPKQSGNFVYSLVSENLHGSKTTDRLPIVVMPERHLRILFIQKFPTAEVRFLKNFLSSKDHQIALRYQVSKNKFSYEYANMPRERIDNLDFDLLNSFDLFLMDQKSYDELNVFEKTNLKKSIAKGLGVIFLLYNTNEKVLNEFIPIKSKITSKDTVHLRLSSSLHVLPVLPIELRNDASIIPVTKNKNLILSGYFFSGRGRIGFQLVQGTFRLAAEGNTDTYSSLWTNLIRGAARTKESNFKLKLITSFPYYSKEPIKIEAISTGPQPSLYADSVHIPMKENALVDDYWTGRSWVGKSGWHQLTLKQDSTLLNYYVSDTSEWKSLRISNQINDNQVFQKVSTYHQKKELEQASVPLLLFYLLFLASSAFLWLAPKI